jgi:glutathione-independent formaldehyde dehydrogenase
MKKQNKAMHFPIGKSFEKGLTMGAGQCNVKRYNKYLRDLLIAGVAKSSFVVSHEIKIDETPVAYEKFDKRIEGIKGTNSSSMVK